LVESNEQAKLGGLTRAQLGAFRPKLRPQSAQQEAQTDAEAEGAAAPAATAPVVATSLVPKARPANSAKLAAAARSAQAAVAATTGETSNNAAATRVTAAVPAPKVPSGPAGTRVANAATVKNAINLRKVNLMGVYGSSSDRRALVRLPSGRLVTVKVGDRIDGGRVQSIANSSLTYTKGGRSLTLNVGS
jgi:type IV pilus biogenesis protein PilP